MKYVYAPDVVFQQFLNTGQVKEFSPTIKQSPDRLTEEEKQEVSVFELKVVTQPPYDPRKERLVETDPVLVEGEWTQQWEVIPLTEAEFNAQQPPEEQVDPIAIKKLLQKQFEALTVPDEEINDYASLFPAFKVGEAVIAGDRRQYEGEVWQVIQGHTTQLDWLPPDVPAIWGRVYDPETIPLWVQPNDAEDPNLKHTGDKVQWPEGTIWVSTIDNNTYEPGVYGWELV